MNKKRFYLASVLVCLALVVTACGDPSQAPSLGLDGMSTTTPGITEAPAATGPVLFQDNFTKSTSGWGTGSNTDRTVDYMQGTLDFKVFAAADFVFSTPSDTDYTDVHMEVSIAPNDSNLDTAFGFFVISRSTTTPSIMGDHLLGKYTIAKAVAKKPDYFLTSNNSWVISTAIPDHQVSYALGIDCGSDGMLTLYVNGRRIDSIADSTYAKGHVGLFAWSSPHVNAADVNFSNFKITSIR